MDKRMLRRGVVIVMIMICIVSLSFTPIWTKADNVNAISLRKEGDAADIVDIKYSTDNGTSWNTLEGFGITFAENVTKVIIKINYDSNKYMVQDALQSVTADGVIQSGKEYVLSVKQEYRIQIDKIVRSVTWAYNEKIFGEDAYVAHGKVEILSAIKQGETGQWSGIEEAFPGTSNNVQNYEQGRVVIIPGSTVTVKLTPDYGYQFVSGSLNGNKVTAGSEISTFTFVMPDANLHLSAFFEKSDDKAEVTAKGIDAASIQGGSSVISSGNLKLTVADSSMTDSQKNAMNSSDAAKNITVSDWIEINLEQIVNKGNATDVWSDKLEELKDKVRISLNVGKGLDASASYVVIREHNGVYERLDAQYNKEQGILTFESDKFSEYAIGTVKTDTENNSETAADKTENVQDNTEVQEEAPKTSDKNVEFYIMAACASFILCLAVMTKKLNKN
ncbi:MAG TPA: hypothetical protein DCR83_08695 [Eubacterium sp.]|nr:hypothetical protein [Eubacterium sp.]HCO35039.1 hypothetical protein [Eubacterium sp.]